MSKKEGMIQTEKPNQQSSKEEAQSTTTAQESQFKLRQPKV